MVINTQKKIVITPTGFLKLSFIIWNNAKNRLNKVENYVAK